MFDSEVTTTALTTVLFISVENQILSWQQKWELNDLFDFSS